MAKRLDIKPGDKFGKWHVLGRAGIGRRGSITYKCRCSCGTIRDIIGQELKRGKSRSCGLCRWKRPKLAGQRFSMLKVVEYLGMDHNTKARWLCKCDCGNEYEAMERQLLNGKATNCGCVRKAKPKIPKPKHDLIVKPWGIELTLKEAVKRYAKVGIYAVRSRLRRGWQIEDALSKPLQIYQAPRKRR